MTAREYAELRALASEELIGSEREDARLAMVGYAMYRVQGGEHLHLKDFIPQQLENERQAQSLDEMESTLLSLIPVDNGNPSSNQHQSSA
jgi:hypothetical protein